MSNASTLAAAEPSPARPWFRRKRYAIPLALVAVLLALALFAYVNPWPSSLLIRAVFADMGDKTTAEMKRYEPPADAVEATMNVQYAPGGSDTRLDLFSPSYSTGPLPTVIWIHGGAWIQGDKSSRAPYARILAVEGYTVATLNYTVAPDAIYPTAIAQLTDALAFLVDHADEYRIDPDRLVIAGDSAGSQLTSQLAAMITNPAYAAQVGIAPSLAPDQLRGVILNCGVYDVSEIANAIGIEGWGFRTALWAYLGTKDWAKTAGGEEMSTIDDVTADFPATWISGGNADALTASQSLPFAAKLKELGVDTTELFFAADTVPGLPHEYQFHLDLENAHVALTSTLDWLKVVTAE